MSQTETQVCRPAPGFVWKGTVMLLAGIEERLGPVLRISAEIAPKHSGGRGGVGRVLILVCLAVLVLTAVAFGQRADDEEGYDQINRRGFEQIDRLNAALQHAGKIFVWVGAALLLIVAWRIISPFRTYDILRDRLLKRAVRDVDDLLKRIQAEMEAASGDAKKETAAEGLLAGLTEVAEFANEEQVPSYVLTVNDVMLDNIRTTLRKLRHFTEGNAERYRDYLFSVIQGIKTITEQSAEAGVSSGLAVNIKEYFGDDRRYKAWRRLLGRFAKRGKYCETADSFSLFMRNVKEGKPLAVSKPMPPPAQAAALSSAEETPAIPGVLSEETLPALQQAAAREVRNLCSFVQTGRPPDSTHAWQFEFVRRQQQVHLRDEAQRMLAVFLSCERKTLRETTKIRMLPCRTWGHVLHVLGVESGGQLQKRIDDRLLTVQEVIILEKAFLQTFAKRESLERIYGRGEAAGLMMDLHVPQIRREALTLLRRSHQTQLKHLDEATEALNEEETPQHHEVKRLIEHYVHHRHDPPGLEGKRVAR